MQAHPEEAFVDVRLIHFVKMLLDQAAVGRFGRPEGDLLPVDFARLFHPCRIHPHERFMDLPLPADHAQFLGLHEKLVPEFRMGDADHGHRPLLDVFAEEIDHAVFADHIGGVGCRDHDGAGRYFRDDIAFALIERRRRDDHDGLAARRHRCASREIHHAGDVRVMVLRDAVRGDLAFEIDLCRQVDGRHFMMIGYDAGIAHVVRGSQFNGRILIQKTVKLIGSDGARSDHFTVVVALFTVGDDASAVERMDRIEQKLAMHAKIVFLPKGRYNQFRGNPR